MSFLRRLIIVYAGAFPRSMEDKIKRLLREEVRQAMENE